MTRRGGVLVVVMGVDDMLFLYCYGDAVSRAK